MAKSEGNFLTLEQAINMYSSDAMRIALADAGDNMDDANFEHNAANAAILRLTKELAWIEEILALEDSLADGPPTSFFDKVFENEINRSVHRAYDAFEKMNFREALKYGCFDLLSARDTYRFSCKDVPMNRTLIERYLEVSTLLLVPFAPHTMDHTWTNLLKKSSSALTAGWPKAEAPNYGLQQAASYLDGFISVQRRNKMKLEKPPKSKKGAPSVVKKELTKADIFINVEYLPWQELVLEELRNHYNTESNSFEDSIIPSIVFSIQASDEVKLQDEKEIKRITMPFTKRKMEQAMEGGGLEALSSTLSFEEGALLAELDEYLRDALNLQSIKINAITKDVDFGPKVEIYPGNPHVVLS